MGNKSNRSEYRIFYTLSKEEYKDSLPEFENKSSYSEERIDLYYISCATSEITAGFGIKLRDLKRKLTNGKIEYTADLIELKRRSKVDLDNVEHWSKVSQKFDNELTVFTQEIPREDRDHSSHDQIQILDGVFTFNRTGTDMVLKNFLGKHPDIKSLIRDSDLGYAVTSKRRYNHKWETALFKSYFIKSYLNNTETSMGYYKSFCIEGKITKENLNQFKNSLKESNVTVCGYPQFLTKEFNSINN